MRGLAQKRKLFLTSRAKSNLHEMMMMSTCPKGAVLLALQCMATNNVGVDLTAKLVASLPSSSSSFYPRTPWLGYRSLSRATPNPIWHGFLGGFQQSSPPLSLYGCFLSRPPQKYNPITH